jgi:predicted small secreted protein
MRLFICLVLTALTLAIVTGCNTVKGVGTDIHDAAQNTQNAFEGK